jgi:hypothetical protein
VVFSLEESTDDVLVLTRAAGFRCVINFSSETLDSPVRGRVLVASDPTVHADGSIVTLPPSTGAWLQT